MELPEEFSRDPESHKGENGKIAVIAGSRDFTGAPALVAQAALRTGSDLTRILTSEETSSTVASYSENLIVEDYPSAYLDSSGEENAVELADWGDAGVIGPGLGEPEPETVEKILENAGMPFVVDADAVGPALGSEVSSTVFTPHDGEADLIRDRYGSLEAFVEDTGAVVLLKGSVDRIYSREGVREVEDGTPAMTVGGTGDVLTGIIAALLAQGVSRERAAELGARINGRAGETASEEKGGGLLATDLLDQIPRVMNE